MKGVKGFQPGQSGNPGGRPKENSELRELCRSYTKQAIERLVFWLHSKNPKASVSAAQILLDRGYGKPAQSMTGEGGEGPVKLEFCWKPQSSENATKNHS